MCILYIYKYNNINKNILYNSKNIQRKSYLRKFLDTQTKDQCNNCDFNSNECAHNYNAILAPSFVVIRCVYYTVNYINIYSQMYVQYMYYVYYTCDVNMYNVHIIVYFV